MRILLYLIFWCSATLYAEEPALPLFDALQTSTPVRLAHGYQFQVSLLINPAEVTSHFVGWLWFHTLSGATIPCYGLESQLAELSLQTTAAPQTFQRTVLCPATWYRGQGTLSLELRPCAPTADGQCPLYDSTAPDVIRLDTPLVLP